MGEVREVILAKSAGFCFGVKRAVETVYQQVAADTFLPIYTYGLIIHNAEVTRDLEEKGVTVINSEEEIKKLTTGTVIIRAHGVARHIHRLIEQQGLRLIDATCPFVRRIHQIAEKESRAGKTIIIIGSNGHPEVEGIIGWSDGEAVVVETEADARVLAEKIDENSCIVSQTTCNFRKFEDIVDIFCKRDYNGSIVNTICNATVERQIEAARISALADAMIVIGDTKSSNTAKLHEICLNECGNTYFVQTKADLPSVLPTGTLRIGITAGASTPDYIIEEVQNHVRLNF